MAYDQYVAICKPLYYMVIISPQLCGLLVLMSWIMSVLHSLLQFNNFANVLLYTLGHLPFFCKVNQVVQLACSDTFLNYMVMYLTAVLLVVPSLGSLALSLT